MVPVNSNKPNILSCFEVPAGTVPTYRSLAFTISQPVPC